MHHSSSLTLQARSDQCALADDIGLSAKEEKMSAEEDFSRG